MFDTGAFVYTKLSTDSTLLSLVGSTDHIIASYPETITVFPLVIFRELDQHDVEFCDDLPIGSNSTYVVDVYVKEDTPTPISIAVCNIFKGIYWACNYNSDVPDPDALVRHRVMHFTRPLLPSDL